MPWVALVRCCSRTVRYLISRRARRERVCPMTRIHVNCFQELQYQRHDLASITLFAPGQQKSRVICAAEGEAKKSAGRVYFAACLRSFRWHTTILQRQWLGQSRFAEYMRNDNHLQKLHQRIRFHKFKTNVGGQRVRKILDLATKSSRHQNQPAPSLH